MMFDNTLILLIFVILIFSYCIYFKNDTEPFDQMIQPIDLGKNRPNTTYIQPSIVKINMNGIYESRGNTLIPLYADEQLSYDEIFPLEMIKYDDIVVTSNQKYYEQQLMHVQ